MAVRSFVAAADRTHDLATGATAFKTCGKTTERGAERCHLLFNYQPAFSARSDLLFDNTDDLIA